MRLAFDICENFRDIVKEAKTNMVLVSEKRIIKDRNKRLYSDEHVS